MTTTQRVTDSIVIDMDIAASAERIFDALTTPEQLVEWWGDPKVYVCERWDVDLRSGGRYRCVGKSADGSAFTLEGEYLEVDRPRKLVYSWKPSWEEMEPATIVTIEIETTAAGAHLRMTHSGFAGYADARERHSQGWPLVLGWLQEFSEAA